MRARGNPMSKLDADWEQEILQRFEGRENLSNDQLYARYFEKPGLPRDEVFECLKLIEFEYKVPAGRCGLKISSRNSSIP